MTRDLYKHIFQFMVFLSLGITVGCSGRYVETINDPYWRLSDYSVPDPDWIVVPINDCIDFGFTRRDPENSDLGIFDFWNSSDETVYIDSYFRKDDGSIGIRPQYFVLENGKWKKILVGYDGLINELALPPGEECIIHIDLEPLDIYRKSVKSLIQCRIKTGNIITGDFVLGEP